MGPIAEEEVILKQYLLGLLTTEQQTPLEERLLTDVAFCENISVAEDELIDQYLSSDLTDAERESFERHFLLAPERQRKLRFARTLRRYVGAEAALAADLLDAEAARAAEKAPDSVPPAPGKLDSFKLLLTRRTGLAFSLSAALLLCVAAITWFAVSHRTGSPHEPRNIYAVTLTPGLVRESGQTTRVAIPTGADTVQLRLAVPTADYQSYSVSLSTAGRTDVWMADELKPTTGAGENLILVDIPARVLSRDDYVVRLRGRRADGGSEDVSRYTFRVLS